MLVSVIVPARDAGRTIGDCLAALAACGPDHEVIVVDDASADDTAELAARHGARVIRRDRPEGPASARNLGATHARGEVLLFVDADVRVHPDVLDRVAAHFRPADGRAPALDALFGSYDDDPPAKGFFSRYKNLAHHYVHQHGDPDAHTFWAGCGAIRRDAFFAVGGFDTAYREPSIEDIELGYRLTDAGYRIRLDPEIQGAHLKAWTFRDMVATDLRCRAVPWLRLLLLRRRADPDLNLAVGQRVSVVLLYSALIALGIATAFALIGDGALLWLGAALLAGAGVLFLNRGLYGFFRTRLGTGFALRAIPVHLLYLLYCGAAVVWVLFGRRATAPGRRTLTARSRSASRPSS